MALRPNDIAARDGGRIEFRSDPFRVRTQLGGLVAGDGHEIECVFEFTARIGGQASDKQLFSEMLMADRTAVTRDEVAAHIRPSLEDAARSAMSQPIETLLSDAGKAQLEQLLRKSIDAAAFNAGLIIQPPFQLELSSPSLQREQLEAAQRSRIEQQAAGRLDHLRHATELLKQFDSIRAAAPSISAGQVLERIAPGDRGALLEALLAGSGSPGTDRTLYAVAGNALVRIDTGSDSIQPVIIELPTTLGPLRSAARVNIDGQQRLLVGARSGVLLLDPHESKAAITFHDPQLSSALGFNRAVFLPETNSILATHGEAGLVRWDREDPSAPSGRLRTAEMVPTPDGPLRNLNALNDRTIVCSLGSALIVIRDSVCRMIPTGSNCQITTIVVAGDRLFAIREDGSVDTIDREAQQVLRRDCHGGKICAAAGLPWVGGLRLLLASDSGAVDCIGPDDSLVTRYNSVYRGLRSIAASANCIAAVSPDRQRLILWNSWDGRSPAHDLHLTSLTRHRIADIAFG